MSKFRLFSFFLLSLPLLAGSTTVLFQPGSPDIGPFPSNALTISAPTQKTGLQVNLPFPAGCSALSTSSECLNTLLLNQLDGFSVNPRIKVCFSGPVDPVSVRQGIVLVTAGQLSSPIGVDQVIVDPATNCAYAKPAHVLQQQTSYLMVVTSAIRDSSGNPLTSDKTFRACLNQASSGYCQSLASSAPVNNQNNQGDNNGVQLGSAVLQSTVHPIAASLFTTMSATSWLQQARAQVNSGALPGAGSLLGPLATFNMANVKGITWQPQTGVAGVNYDTPLPLSVLNGVDRVAFGLFLSPLYLNTSGPAAGTISTTPTNLPIGAPTAVIPVSFHVWLPPASTAGSGKIPVIIYGHGLSDSQFGAPTFAASTWAQKGFATIAIEITGHGFGPLSTTQVSTATGNITIPTPGRGIQFSPTAPIGPRDGCILPTAVATRDCSRQTAVDLFSLIRTIQTTNGLGLNLDTSRIYYTGQSFGSYYGTLFEAVEPNVSAATLNVGGAQIDAARLSPLGGRQLGAAYLSTFATPLLNVPPAPSQAYFHDSYNDEYVYRGQAITDSVPGAIAIQNAFEQADWLSMLGDPLSFAPHLQTAPLPGVPAKAVLVQFGLGDLEVPNPAESALVRAGDFQNSTWLLRTDKAAGIDPRILGLTQPGTPYPILPHRFLSNPTLFNPASPALATAIGVAAQSQIADFFTSGGASIPNPNQYFSGPFTGVTLFEQPAVLPETLNFLQIQP